MAPAEIKTVFIVLSSVDSRPVQAFMRESEAFDYSLELVRCNARFVHESGDELKQAAKGLVLAMDIKTDCE
jgi:hypothetical protein